MLRFILAFLLLASSSLPAAAGDRRYALADFDRVIVEGPFRVSVAVGGPSTALAQGTQQALDAVSLDVQGTTLRIRPNRSWSGSPGRAAAPATITLTTRKLRFGGVSGSGVLAVSGLKGLRVDLAVEGSGRLQASKVDADTLTLALRGSGSFELAGSVETLSANVQGSGSLQGAALEAETATIIAATSGDIIVGARRAAHVTASGLGRVEVTGQPACTLLGTSAGEIRCGRTN